LLELLSLLEARVMVQPNKADFGVRKLLKRKKEEGVNQETETGWHCLGIANVASEDAIY
jgi:hypothetical protein